MSRATDIVQLCEVSIGTAAGVVRAGVSAARLKQKLDDRVRQAGMGDKLDKAKKDRKAALVHRAKNPLSKKRRAAHIDASDKVADVKDAGHAKFKKMMKSASSTGSSEVN